MPYPVSVKEACKIEKDVIDAVQLAAERNRLIAAIDIMLEYISASLCLDLIDDLLDMVNDPDEPLPVPRTPEEYKAIWDSIHVHPIAKEVKG